MRDRGFIHRRDPVEASLRLLDQRQKEQKRRLEKTHAAMRAPTFPIYADLEDGPVDPIDTQIAFFGAVPGDPGSKPYYRWDGAWHPFGDTISWAIAYVEYDLTGAGSLTLAPYGDPGADADFFLTNDPDLFEIDVTNSGIKINSSGAFDVIGSARVISGTAAVTDWADMGIAETTNMVVEGTTSLYAGLPRATRPTAILSGGVYQFRPNVTGFLVFSSTDTVPVTVGTYLDYTQAGTWTPRATLLIKSAGAAVTGFLP